METGGVLGSFGSVMISDLGILFFDFLNNFSIVDCIGGDCHRRALNQGYVTEHCFTEFIVQVIH